MRAALVKSSQVKSSHFRPLDFHHCWPPRSTFDRLPYVGPCVCGYVCCLYRLDLIGYPYRICVCCLCIYRLDLTALPLGSKYQVATQCHSTNDIPAFRNPVSVRQHGSQVGRRSPAAPRPVPRDGRYTVGTRPIESFPRAYVAVYRDVCQCACMGAGGVVSLVSHSCVVWHMWTVYIAYSGKDGQHHGRVVMIKHARSGPRAQRPRRPRWS